MADDPAVAAREIRTLPIHAADPDRYECVSGAVADIGGGEAVQGAISEADLRARLAEEGAAILDAVAVVERAMRGRTRTFYPYLRTTWAPDEHLGIALYRERGLRGWNDPRTLLDVLEDWGYRGRLVLIHEGDPLVAELGLAAPTP